MPHSNFIQRRGGTFHLACHEQILHLWRRPQHRLLGWKAQQEINCFEKYVQISWTYRKFSSAFMVSIIIYGPHYDTNGPQQIHCADQILFITRKGCAGRRKLPGGPHVGHAWSRQLLSGIEFGAQLTIPSSARTIPALLSGVMADIVKRQQSALSLWWQKLLSAIALRNIAFAKLRDVVFWVFSSLEIFVPLLKLWKKSGNDMTSKERKEGRRV